MGLLDAITQFASSDEGMGLAQGLLSARGSQGLAAGVAGMQEARRHAEQKQMQALQMQAMQLQLQNAQRDAAKQEQMQQMYAKFATPPVQGMGSTEGVNAALPSQFQIGAQPQIGAGNKPAGYDFQGLAGALAQVNPMASLDLQAKLKKELPKFGTEPRQAINPSTGKPGTYIVAENGETKWIDAIPRDKLEEVNLGGKVGFRNPYEASIVGALQKTQTPDSVASNQLGWANNSLSAQRLALDRSQVDKPQFHDGQWVTPPNAQNPQGASAPVPGFSKPMGEGQKKQVTGIDALGSAIDEYKKELGTFSTSDLLRPDRRASMGTKYNNMMLQAKEAYNLGVLNGPDYQILQSVIADPTSMKGAFISNGALQKQASELDRLMKGTREAVVNGGKPMPQKSNVVDSLPAANPANKGQRIRDTETGKILKSNGMSWVSE